MGNGISSSSCFSGCARRPRLRRRHVAAAVTSEPFDEGLGHSFCYVSSSKLEEELNNTNNSNLYSISGASVSANPSTALSTSLDPYSSYSSAAAAFDSSTSFSSVPLRRVGGGGGGNERGFLSGPIERGFLSGPLDDHRSLFSGPLDGSGGLTGRLRRSLSHSLFRSRNKGGSDDNHSSGSIGLEPAEEQWAQGKAGEDRVHVVVSEENDSVFVGIYDGFNGPDATDFLLSNLYASVRKELEAVRSQGQGQKSHLHVLKALSRALRRTEEDYFEVADKMSAENPELALMGSCVLVMLMKGEDVYLMSVGDSRAVLARTARRRHRGGRETSDELVKNLAALQLTLEHSTSVKEEVLRIRNEHPDDGSAIANDRVKGSLKVTRAFGAGFLKQPKWNNALLEMFRIDYVGTSPYITCNPSLSSHPWPKGQVLDIIIRWAISVF
ncbi:putative protein phosphatase 2C 23 [Iris pallida]|uniref:protein-serine/threonine phosphatase n=1 Tax=Iris pallida TaxID=29817 RepID=A0AAX6FFT6_IRIPA|nr:putative protein phosphatase 2C 23 [Iris pallida]